jgi:autotransporter-associated beta strand protein
MSDMKFMKRLFFLFLLLSFLQPLYSQRRMEDLDRGLVAVKLTNGVYLQWRIGGEEWFDASYNVYRDGVKIHNVSTTGASNYSDPDGTLASKYKVSAVVGGVEEEACAEVSVLANPYREIAMEPIARIAGVPDSYYALYEINDITTADLDGDGAYDFIVKRLNKGYDAAKPFENQYYHLFDAYKSDGTFMWRIDIGPNLTSDVEMDVLAYDFDGDGKAEVVIRTSEGTKDGTGYVIPDLGNAMGEPIPDGKTNYRDRFQQNTSWYEYEGPEYLSLFDGQSGAMLDRIDYIARQPAVQWGSSGMSDAQLAHRACKYHYGAPYLDGKRPSVLITRGIYHRIKMATYDVVGKKFVPRWTFDSQNGPYSAQGNHNYSIADVDNDGRDEIVYGSMTIDDDGSGLYTTQLGHGDAIHVGDLDPYRKGLEVFACLENSPYYGTTLRTAETGDILLQYIKGSDCGRAIAANVTGRYKGAELAPSASGSFSASERREVPVSGGSQNFRIYWDGDLLEELVDHNDFTTTIGKGVGKVQKYNGSSWNDIMVTAGYYSCNYTKGTPCLQADLFGDWREELIYRSNDDSNIRIYFTTEPTEHRIYTLMHDMQYRQAIAWQMCGYNQPPHVSYFLGEEEGILLPPPPVMDNGRSLGVWVDGKDVLFDISTHTGAPVLLTEAVGPKNLFVNSTDDYVFESDGNGRLTGTMRLEKQGAGGLTISGNHDFSGVTELWDGSTSLRGDFPNTPVWLNRFAELSVAGTLGSSLSMSYGSVLRPEGTVRIGKNLVAGDGSSIELDWRNNGGDSLIVRDTLFISGQVIFRIQKTGELAEGEYLLAQAGRVEGDLKNIQVEGLESQILSVSYADGKLVLSVRNMRTAASVVWKGDQSGAVWNLAKDENFRLGEAVTYFSIGDDVLFDDSSDSKTVNKEGNLPAGNVLIDATGDYVIQGGGKLTGAANLSKNNTGKLTLRGINEYTGATIITGGTLAVEDMPNLEYAGSIGFGSDNPDLFVLDGGIFTSALNSGTLKSSKAIRIGSRGGTFHTNIPFEWTAVITGGVLTKTGNGNLALFGANTHDKLIVGGGSVTLKTEAANPGKNIVLESGTLYCLDNKDSYSTATWNIEVPEGSSGTISLDSRCNYQGALTGGGVLNIQSPYLRSDLSGNWSAFTGVLNVTTDSDGGDLRFNNTYGLAKAELNLTGKLTVYNNAGSSFAIGALSGGSSDTKLNEEAWTVGAKNVNTTFGGIITGASLTKIGTGALKLTNANTYSGATAVSGGCLLAMNTTGSATGTGSVSVANDGVLGGKGFVEGNVTVGANASIEPGDPTAVNWIDKIGTLTLNRNLTLNGTLRMNVRNGTGYLSDKLVVKGTSTINGSLILEIVDGASEFALETELTLLNLQGTVAGAFTSLNLPPTVPGTVWDTHSLLTTGKIKVVRGTAIPEVAPEESLKIYPNPAKDYFIVDLLAATKVEIRDLSGILVWSGIVSPRERVDISALPEGIYLVTVAVNEKGERKGTSLIKNGFACH